MYRFSHFFAEFIIWTAFCAVPALAFDVSVKANVDNAQVFVGDIFNYEIQVTAPENAVVDLPSFVGNLGSFEVKEMKNEKVVEGMPKGTAKFVWYATLNTFVSGDFLIAPQQVNAVVGSDTVKVNTDPVAVKVSTRTTGEEDDILEAEDPLDDPRLPQWIYVLLIVVGVALLVFLGWFLHKKFAKKGEAPRLPPYEEAVLALKELRAKNYLAEGNQGDYFMALGFIAPLHRTPIRGGHSRCDRGRTQAAHGARGRASAGLQGIGGDACRRDRTGEVREDEARRRTLPFLGRMGRPPT